MTIQFSTDNNIAGNAKLETYIKTTIKDEFVRFSDFITRIEVHLADENGIKNGQKDKRCMLEARLKNRQPIAVTSHANTIEEAVMESIKKLKSATETIVGKIKNH